MMKLGIIVPHQNKILKHLNHVKHPISSVNISFFSPAALVISRDIDIDCILINSFQFFKLFVGLYRFLIIIVAILVLSAKLAILALLKIKVFWNKNYDLEILVHEVIKKILLRCSSYNVDVLMWINCVNFSIFMREVIIRMTRKRNFLEACTWFKFNELVLELGMTFKICASLSKEFKTIVRHFGALFPTFLEITA